jgi:protein subunit release factor A
MAPKDENPARQIDPLAVLTEPDEVLLSECRVDTFRSGGKGGQHQNTTDSGVRLTHLPTGIVVISRSERSQHRNRKLAIERLRMRISDIGKVRKTRVPTRVPPAERKRRLTEKRTRAKQKETRRPPAPDE